MWIEFYFVALVMCLMLVVPGHLFLRALGMERVWAICSSPLVSLSLIALFGQALSLVGIAATPVLVLCPLVLLPAAALVAMRRRGLEPLDLPRIEPWIPLAYVAVGAALGYNLYISRLGSPDALFQAYDITQHVGLIQSMSESGRLTSIGASAYLSATDAAIAPVDLSGFYPAAWHSFCALAVMLTGTSVTVAINASMFVIPCIAFPLAMLALLASLFPESRGLQACGALTSLAFVAFPWNLIAFGPVYPNVVGFSLMPSAMALFVNFLGKYRRASERVRLLVTIALCALGLALCHPNTIFTCVALLAPYVVHRICDTCNERGASPLVKALAAGGFVLFVAAFWVVSYHLPFLQSTVTHVWDPFAWAWQEIVNILTLSYTFGFNVEISAQLVLAALVVFGFVKAIMTPGRRWLAASYLIVCYILLISVTHQDEYKQMLAGFWYTDPMRLASNCAIAAIPLATLGIKWVFDVVRRVVGAYNSPKGRPVAVPLVIVSVSALFLLVNFMPEFNLAGMHYVYSDKELEANSKIAEVRDWPKHFHTTFGDYRSLAEEVFSYTQPLDKSERAFVDKVKELVESEDALIVNNPMDGSFLAYGTDGLRLYYRNFIGFETETELSRTIRLHLNEYAHNEVVRQAVEDVDARYVLVMNGDEDEASFINMRGNYDADMFSGITSITRDTEGFTFVYGFGRMALYKIDR